MSPAVLVCLLAQASPGATTTTTATTSAPPFIKGELAHVGQLRLVPKRSFIGVRVGFLLQEETVYAQIAPKVDLRFLEGKLRLGLEVPLNVEVYDGRAAADAGDTDAGFDDWGRLRPGDYDEARDFVKFLRYLTYGKKEDHLYVNIGQLFATTIGHGQRMRRYAANVDVNQTRVGVEVDAYDDYGGFEAALADVTRATIFSALAFLKPLSLFTENPRARSFSVGVSWASDQQAPYALRRADPVGSATLGPVIVDEGRYPLADTRPVNLFGIDAELKVLKTPSSDLKVYGDFSSLDGGGSGITVGLLGRFNFRTEGGTVHLLRTRLELRTYEADYVPSYFDTLYEFQKYEVIVDPDARTADTTTKLRYVLEREGPRRYGVYVEATYSIPGWFIFAVAFETESEGQDQHLMAHVEIPWEYLDVFATYHQRNLQRPFTLRENDLIFAGARLKLLPILFINGRVQKSFEWDRSQFDGLGAYAESLNYQGDIELGWEF